MRSGASSGDTHPPRPWQPVLRGRARWIPLTLQAAALLTVGIVASFSHYRQHALEEANLRHPSPLAGEWHLDTGTLLTGDGVPMSDLVLEPDGRLNVRDTDGILWGGSTYRTGQPQLSLAGPGLPSVTYAITQPDASHLILTPTDSTANTLRLTRVPLPAHYPLLERGFHLVNEWGLER